MQLYLQYGSGMKEHTIHFMNKWKSGTVILSPRDIEPEKINRYSQEFIENGGNILFDPQLYVPRATHHRLKTYEYWPDNYETSMLTGGPKLRDMLKKLYDLNCSIKAKQFIIPGIYGNRVDEDWLSIQNSLIEESRKLIKDEYLLGTVCLSSEALRYEDQIELLLNTAEGWDIDGLYIIPEHPKNQYLVDDPIWLSNLLNLCAGLKLINKKVIVGYCNHQMLCLSAAKVDAICTGTHLNVRNFNKSKFDNETSTKQKSTWFYSPKLFSEFKIIMLDAAQRLGILELLKPENSEYGSILFSGAKPTNTDFKEQLSNRHYINCLYNQCETVSNQSFKETLKIYRTLLKNSGLLLKKLHSYSITGDYRDFSDYIDINLAALNILEKERGFVLERV